MKNSAKFDIITSKQIEKEKNMDNLLRQKVKLEKEIAYLQSELEAVKEKIEYCEQSLYSPLSYAVDANRDGFWDEDGNYHTFRQFNWENENNYGMTQK